VEDDDVFLVGAVLEAVEVGVATTFFTVCLVDSLMETIFLLMK
jgi:hypothetical protein